MYCILVLTTVFSPVTAELELHTTAYNRIPDQIQEYGQFSVDSRTTHSPVSIEYIIAPLNSTILLNVQTTESPVEVVMHRTYEGYFFMKNNPSPFPPSPFPSPSQTVSCSSCFPGRDPDPRKDRKRSVVQQSWGQNVFTGNVFWGEKAEGNRGKSRGDVRIETTNNHTSLIL